MFEKILQKSRLKGKHLISDTRSRKRSDVFKKSGYKLKTKNADASGTKNADADGTKNADADGTKNADAGGN